ncbi:hypothetical protein GCM10018779_31000 [Streptomyces griseocarneus]|nr:hypothetical protein GCM10018779_31000 [Streptomyces griseocarneus]
MGSHTNPECKDQRAYVFYGTVAVAAMRLWLRQKPTGQPLVDHGVLQA